MIYALIGALTVVAFGPVLVIYLVARGGDYVNEADL